MSKDGDAVGMGARWVTYDGKASDSQVQWGSNDDPRGLLEPGVPYELTRYEVHTWHTKVHLAAFPGKRFNSVNFQSVAAPTESNSSPEVTP